MQDVEVEFIQSEDAPPDPPSTITTTPSDLLSMLEVGSNDEANTANPAPFATNEKTAMQIANETAAEKLQQLQMMRRWLLLKKREAVRAGQKAKKKSKARTKRRAEQASRKRNRS